MPNMNIGMMRNQTKPGDMLIRVHDGAVLGWGIKVVSGGSDFVHGGLAVGQDRLVEVNGALGASKHTGQGAMSRLLANVVLTHLYEELRGITYVCYRPIDAELGLQVAIEAYPFARVGVDKSFGYNIGAAIKSTPVWRKLFGTDDKHPTGQFLYLDENESVLSAALEEKKSFFCTQFMVWMYQKTAEKMRRPFTFPLQPKDALPAALVEALDRSPLFTYQGVIRPMVK